MMRALSRLLLAVCCLLATPMLLSADAASRPNVLWVTSEDNGPQLGAYGDEYATTPNLDALAAKGMIYLNASSTAPVCAPARTTIISGVYPPSTGGQHMRSMAPLPSFMKMYPQYLREAGYYCTNHTKEDYNLEKPEGVWDESGGNAHWRNREEGQPFFAIFNFTISHESKLRTRPHVQVHDPAKAPVPAYHPDTPEVRQDWAQYYDKITEMDTQVGDILKQLEEDGLADDTIIFYYGDHGSGMPRSKRWPYNSGLQVPMIVHVPEKFKDLAPEEYAVAGESKRPVGFIDLAPTLLSTVGIEPPKYMQGDAFMGEYEAPAREFNFGFRGRMDERYDMVRSVRDDRYMYIRNYKPHKIYGQYIAYMFQTPTTVVWKQLYDEGKLNKAQSHFWETKPAEELYDLVEDPDEVNNLVDSPDHQEILKKLRTAQRELAIEIRDLGFLPEAEIHSRSVGTTPYEMGHDHEKYPVRRIMRAAELASSLRPKAVPNLIRAFEDEDSAVRFWAALGMLMRGEEAVAQAKPQLLAALSDEAPTVRIAAAEALGRYGSDEDAAKAIAVLIELAPADINGAPVAMAAVNAIDYLDERGRPAVETLKTMELVDPKANTRMKGYVTNLVGKILADLGEEEETQPKSSERKQNRTQRNKR